MFYFKFFNTPHTQRLLLKHTHTHTQALTHKNTRSEMSDPARPDQLTSSGSLDWIKTAQWSENCWN